MKNKSVRNLVLAGVFLALGLVLPFLTMQIPAFGSMLLPMHIPVLLCGFACGWPYGLLVGFATPLVRSLLFGMPPMFPTALAMAFELAVYGLVTGLLYKKLPKRPQYLYASLVGAMLAGRVVWGVVSMILYRIAGSAPFTWELFVASGFVNAWPGIVLQIVLIPPVIMLLQKARVIDPS